MIKITKVKDKECPTYYRLEHTDLENDSWALYHKQLIELHTKLTKLLQKDKDYCVNCKADLFKII